MRSRLAACLPPLAACLAWLAPAAARAEDFRAQFDLGLAGVMPVYPASAWHNSYPVGGMFFGRLGGLGERSLFHVTGLVGMLGPDGKTIVADLKGLAPRDTNTVSGMVYFAGGLVGGGVFVAGGKMGGVYLRLDVGGGATWATKLRYAYDPGDGTPTTLSEGSRPPAAPFGYYQRRLILSAAVGVTSGKRDGKVGLSAASELGAMFFFFDGAPVGLLTLSVQFGGFLSGFDRYP